MPETSEMITPLSVLVVQPLLVIAFVLILRELSKVELLHFLYFDSLFSSKNFRGGKRIELNRTRKRSRFTISKRLRFDSLTQYGADVSFLVISHDDESHIREKLSSIGYGDRLDE